MKRFFISLFSIAALVAFYSLCYCVSFRHSVNRMEQEKTQQNIDLDQFAERGNTQSDIEDENRLEQEEVQEISYDDTSIVSADTVCIYELYYIDTDEKLRYELPPSSDIAGLTRKQLSDKLKDYMNHLPITEYEEGLIAYELLSFSSERIVLQKVYDRNRINYRYFITISNDEIVVYYSDKKTIYEYTGISAKELDDWNYAALVEGITIKDTEALYDFLAGVTS